MPLVYLTLLTGGEEYMPLVYLTLLTGGEEYMPLREEYCNVLQPESAVAFETSQCTNGTWEGAEALLHVDTSCSHSLT